MPDPTATGCRCTCQTKSRRSLPPRTSSSLRRCRSRRATCSGSSARKCGSESGSNRSRKSDRGRDSDVPEDSVAALAVLDCSEALAGLAERGGAAGDAVPVVVAFVPAATASSCALALRTAAGRRKGFADAPPCVPGAGAAPPPGIGGVLAVSAPKRAAAGSGVSGAKAGRARADPADEVDVVSSFASRSSKALPAPALLPAAVLPPAAAALEALLAFFAAGPASGPLTTTSGFAVALFCFAKAAAGPAAGAAPGPTKGDTDPSGARQGS